MKTKRTRRLQIVLGLSLLVAAGMAAPLFAQSTETMVAKISFEFVAGDRTLPAGEYIVRPAGRALQIRSTVGQESSFAFITNSIQRPKVTWAGGKLIFNKYGATYFLSEIWKPESRYGHELLQSSLERELAQGKSIPQVTSVVAQQQ